MDDELVQIAYPANDAEAGRVVARLREAAIRCTRGRTWRGVRDVGPVYVRREDEARAREALAIDDGASFSDDELAQLSELAAQTLAARARARRDA